MKKIKVLIIDDSNIVHALLEKIISQNEQIEIIGNAYDGVDGIMQVKNLKPDVVVMDIGMPRMGGLEAIQKIMEENPTPIIVFSAASQNMVDLSFKAIELGAVDLVEKPFSNDMSILKNNIETHLIKSIINFSDFKVIRRINKSKISSIRESTVKHSISQRINKEITTNKKIDDFDKKDFPIIGIAASTGGPQTLKGLIEDLSSRNIYAGIVIVQHMAEGFMQGFCDWLAGYSKIPVVLAEEKDYIKPGYIYIAPGEYHLIFDKTGKFEFLDSPPIQGIKPSADLMFNSLGEVFKNRVIGVILTGMGNDGTEGLRVIKEHGGYVISQDEESSLIFGMPKSAIDAGVVDIVMNVSKIPETLEKLCNERVINRYGQY